MLLSYKLRNFITIAAAGAAIFSGHELKYQPLETGFRKWIIVVTIITSTIIELIDTTIVNVSINTMSGNLGASLEDTAWVITSYAIANVIIIPMTSFLAEK